MGNLASSSLYTRSKDIIEFLSTFPEWKQQYLDPLPNTFKEQKPTEILWALFRQGGTLCYILNILMKNTISYIEPLNFDQQGPDFDSKSCKMNVFNFLQACQEDFFMSSDQLFSVSEIYKDDSTVLLRAIKLVEGLLSRIDSATWLAPNQVPLSPEAKNNCQSFDFFKKSLSLNSLDKASTNSQSSQEEGTVSSQVEFRKKAVQELLDTERTYVNQMDFLQEYLQEIENDNEREIPQQEIDIIFCNLNELLDFQRFFLIDMEAVLTKPTDQQRIGHLFLSTITQSKTFATYYEYVANFERAASAVIRNSEYLKVGQLQSYLIKPIQRICRYHILLKEIKKYSDLSSVETVNIIRAYELMKKIAEQINEEKRKAENLRIVNDLRGFVANWGKGYSIDNFTPLQLFGTFQVLLDDASEEKQLLVFLFEKGILLGKGATLINSATISSLTLLECIEKSFITNILNTSEPGNTSHLLSIAIYRLKIFWYAEKPRSMTISFINEEQHKKWYLLLSKLIGKKDDAPNDESIMLKPTEISSREKSRHRRSKLKKLLGSPKRNESPPPQDYLSSNENFEFSSKQKRRLVKIIHSTSAKLALLSEDYDFEQFKESISPSGGYLFHYRDRQKDLILLESSEDFILALEDWFGASDSCGAFPLVLMPKNIRPE